MATTSGRIVCILVMISKSMTSLLAFTPISPSVSPQRIGVRIPRGTTTTNTQWRREMLPLDSLTSAVASSLSSSSSSLIVSVVEYFDGSQVIDPVVVSDSFWNGFSSRIISLLIGQFLAVMAFGIITTLASQQITKAGEWVANQWFSKTIADATRGESSTTTQTNTGTAATPRQSAAFVRKPDFIRLLLCVTLDIVGTSNEIVPVVGEVADVVWAPIAAILLRNLFGGVTSFWFWNSWKKSSPLPMFYPWPLFVGSLIRYSPHPI